MRGGPEALLAKIGLHTQLTPQEATALAGVVAHPILWKAGALVAAVGDPLDTATVVLEGLLARTKTLPDGRTQILSLLVPGDVVDAHATVLRQRDDELVAISDARVALVPQSRIVAIGADFPKLHEAFLREAFIEAAVVREWVLNIGRRTAIEATAHFLCEYQHRLCAVGLAEPGRAPFPLKQAHLADCLGLSIIHVNRVLQQLRADGLIKLEHRQLIVPDVDALWENAGFNPQYLHLTRAPKAGLTRRGRISSARAV